MLAIGFDLGETLIFYRGLGLSWEERYPAAFNAVGAACNIPMDEKRIDQARSVLRRYNTRATPRIEEVRCEAIFVEIFDAWGIECKCVPENAISAFFRYFQDQAEIYPDTVSALEHIRELGVPIGILTDVPYGMSPSFVREDLRRAGIDHLLDVVLTSYDVGMRKPHPKGFEMLASALSTKPADFMFVGNEAKDITGANNAGIFSVLIDREHTASKFGQGIDISGLAELVELVKLLEVRPGYRHKRLS